MDSVGRCIRLNYSTPHTSGTVADWVSGLATFSTLLVTLLTVLRARQRVFDQALTVSSFGIGKPCPKLMVKSGSQLKYMPTMRAQARYSQPLL